MRWDTIVGAIIFIIILIAILLPFIIIIKFPDVSEQTAEISKTYIPWIVILIILILFNQDFKNLFFSLTGAIDRLKSASLGSAKTEFSNPQESLGSLSTDELNEFNKLPDAAKTKSSTEYQAFLIYFYRYILLSIYGSQIKLLRDLSQSGEKTTKELEYYYNLFISREPKQKDYKFSSYIDYLYTNLLIKKKNDNLYEIDFLGTELIKKLDELKIPLDNFPG